jgi:hypothetical protein
VLFRSDVVDLTNQKKVDEWFKNKRFDVVIHCATAGGLRTQTDGTDVTHQNLQMFYNLLRNKNRFNKSYRHTVRSKHKRHQGAKEIARRASQIERGILKIN